MRSATIELRTSAPREILIVTDRVEEALRDLAGSDREGICTLFTPHTTAALTINENADPDVPRDLTAGLEAMIPEIRFHHMEGNSDAHLLSALIGASLAVPYRGHRLLLGRWQGIYFVELDGPRRREFQVYV